ncbi:MAG: hypothetical protein KIT11_02295 [Fimbriimonadaceae bacterium]|nr:hypothetical protein [Fimbriimonadaceae bacterium]QYK54801.1 MAG: hypothetical protein KF733_07240 [Fimbriimonadaceae bacterium]
MKQRKGLSSILALGAALALAGSALAQQGGPPPQGMGPGGPGGRGGRGGGLVAVLQMSTVQKHLGLTAQQIQQLQLMRPPRRGEGGGEPGKVDNPIEKVLNANQAARAKQLALQFDAPMSLMGPEAEGLKLTEQQRDAIRQIIEKAMPRPEQGERRDQGQRLDWNKMQAAKAGAYKQALALLSANQKQVWAKLTGDPFTQWVEPQRPNRD